MSPFARNEWLLPLALLALVACTHETRAATVVLGSVVDAATGEPLAGVEVSAKHAAQTRASGISDAAGRFQLQFDAPAGPGPHAFVLAAGLAGYRAASEKFDVRMGRSSVPNHALRLVPEAVAACIQHTRPAVVVGHFRAAPGNPDPDLSERIAEALRYDLLTQIQKAEFRSAQPGIYPCKAAEPKTPQRFASLAKLLGADAFVSGYVTRPNPVKVKVQMAVSDGYGELAAPLNAASPDVDLDDPQLARLAPEAHAAVLTALAIGYKLSNKPGECVDLIAASERMLGTLPEALLRLREQCQAALPNRGLL